MGGCAYSGGRGEVVMGGIGGEDGGLDDSLCAMLDGTGSCLYAY